MSLPKLEVLGTRVARRVLFLFMAGAAVPVAVMAFLSFSAITSELRQQSEVRLSLITEVQTQSILGRLSNLAAQTRTAGTLAYRAGLASPDMETQASADLLPPGLDELVVEHQGLRLAIPLRASPTPTLSQEQRARVERNGNVLLVDRSIDASTPRIVMVTPLDAGGPESGTVWASIIGDSIWGGAVTQAADPSVEDMCVLDASGWPLFCLSGTASPLPAQLAPPAERPLNSGQARVPGDDGERVVAWRDIYLRASFDAPSWALVVSQPTTATYGAADTLAYNLLLTILIGLSAALLVTHILVRRTMEPLRDLSAGTERLAKHDLSARVEVRSNDEFGDLASSFNTMAERLGIQFNQLEARRAIDHAALTASDYGRAIRALLIGVGTVTPSGVRALALTDPELPGAATLFIYTGDGGAQAVDVRDVATAVPRYDSDSARVVELRKDVPPVFEPVLANGGKLPLVILPLTVGARQSGAMAIASDGTRPMSASDSVRAQELADQAAIALEKLRLDREVAAMGWETLRALANAIDAKSAWTKGHSERVTGLSLVMGRAIGLSDEDLNVLHRGGLLHDIGKIGVPAEVLDFDGVLTPEMRRLMEMHPAAGARILEPIRAFRPIVPIVLHHHERWDGSGYPDGLTGEDIPLLARLVAVADVFDAMVSARPYRPALDPDVVWRHVRDRSGSDFDPAMVEALDRVMRGGWRPAQRREAMA